MELYPDDTTVILVQEDSDTPIISFHHKSIDKVSHYCNQVSY